VKPALGDVLTAISARVAGSLLPALPPGYLQADAMVLALLLAGAAEEQERGADTRSTDIEEMRAIFVQAAATIPPGDLRERSVAATRDMPSSRRISDLDACHDRMRAVLVDLHAVVEASDDPRMDEVDRAIWRHLRESVARHAMTTNPF
jgi:hypothetical protein